MFDTSGLKTAEDYMLLADKKYTEMIKEKDITGILSIIAKHGEYSFRNAMLIHLQNPGAVNVMTVPSLKKAGYTPRSGETPIVIFKQLYDPYTDKGEKYATGHGIEALKSGVYQKVYLYDTKQAFGMPSPVKRNYTYKDIEKNFEAVKDVLMGCLSGYNVEIKPGEGNRTADFIRSKKAVRISPGLEGEVYLSTLLQVAVYALLADRDKDQFPFMNSCSRDSRMVERECVWVNYIIAKRFGFKTPVLKPMYTKELDEAELKLFKTNLIFVRKIANIMTNKITNAIIYSTEEKKEEQKERENRVLGVPDKKEPEKETSGSDNNQTVKE